MKKLFFSLAVAVISTGAFAQAKADDIAKIQSETIDQGKIEVDHPVTATFVVKNTSNKDLIIESANPTCGCTIGNYTKTPIKPGETGTIEGTYNAKGLGVYEKHMTVKFAGADDMKSITIKGEVLSAEDYAKIKGNAAPSTVAAVKPAATATPVVATKTAAKATPAKKVTKTKTTAKAASKTGVASK
jgi:hypothetical protein